MRVVIDLQDAGEEQHKVFEGQQLEETLRAIRTAVGSKAVDIHIVRSSSAGPSNLETRRRRVFATGIRALFEQPPKAHTP